MMCDQSNTSKPTTATEGIEDSRKFKFTRCTRVLYVYTIVKEQIIYCESCLTLHLLVKLLLTIVLGRLRRFDAKNVPKNYQGPTTSRENVIRKHLNFLIYIFIYLKF